MHRCLQKSQWIPRSRRIFNFLLHGKIHSTVPAVAKFYAVPTVTFDLAVTQKKRRYCEGRTFKASSIMDTPTQLEAGNEADSHMADLERSRDSVMQSRDSGEETHDSQEDSEAEGVCTSGLEHDGKFHKYAYVEQGFTSEIFKIEIENFPKYTGYKVRD